MTLKERVVAALEVLDGTFRARAENPVLAESCGALAAKYRALAAELDGMVIVPREPTDAMCTAGFRSLVDAPKNAPLAETVYAAMITEGEK